jgi:hypothetical protein
VHGCDALSQVALQVFGWRFNLAFYLANDAPQLCFQLGRAGMSAFHLASV